MLQSLSSCGCSRDCEEKGRCIAQGWAFYQIKKMQEEFIDIQEIAATFRVSSKAILARVKAGRFPKPITNPREKAVWLKEHVEEWVRQQVERSDPKTKQLNATCRKKAKLNETVRKLKELGIDWNPEQ